MARTASQTKPANGTTNGHGHETTTATATVILGMETGRRR